MYRTVIVALAIAVAGVWSQDLPWVPQGKQEQPSTPCSGADELYFTTSQFTTNGGYESILLYLYIGVEVPVGLKPVVKHDSVKSIDLISRAASYARIVTLNNYFNDVKFFKSENFSSFIYKVPTRRTCELKCAGCVYDTYIMDTTFHYDCVNGRLQSIRMDTHEQCKNSTVKSSERIYIETVLKVEIELKVADECGRRKVEHTELILNGELSKPGDWPWHVAIYRLSGSNIKYICGGTLISKTMVLTAAHCATMRGVPIIPEILSVVLGKYNLIGGDLESQEREVHSVIVHESFTPKNFLEHDIALLRLKSEATLNDYVQPACIWSGDAYERLPSNTITGTVVGWGFDQKEALSPKLNHASMPMVSDATCIKINPLFFGNALNNNMKFCAGWANGTSACNGDSGGAFAVFVPDAAKDSSPRAAGAYHARGIVSLSVARKDVDICDPYQYVIFTDIDKYTGWIKSHLNG